VVVTGSRLVSGIVEALQVAAERFEVDRAPCRRGADANETLHTILSTVLDSTGDDIRASIRAGIASLHADDGREPVLLTKSLERLSPARAAEFRERLRALALEFGPDGDDDGPASAGSEQTQPYGLVVAFYPYADPATPARRSRRGTTKPTTTPTAEEPHR
jgi:hypothetical protein